MTDTADNFIFISTGLDNINSSLLKDSAEVVAGPLTAIMNAPLTTCELPNIWKKSKVTPVYKTEKKKKSHLLLAYLHSTSLHEDI